MSATPGVSAIQSPVRPWTQPTTDPEAQIPPSLLNERISRACRGCWRACPQMMWKRRVLVPIAITIGGLAGAGLGYLLFGYLRITWNGPGPLR